MRISELFIYTLFLLYYIQIIVNANDRIYTKIEKQHFKGDLIVPERKVISIIQCAFLCNSLNCLGFNTARKNNALTCETFENVTQLVPSNMLTENTAWTDSCRLALCDVHIECITALEALNNTCSCKDGYINTENGCQEITTTTASTTAADDSLDLMTVGVDRFIRFEEKKTWDEAKALCQSHGLNLFKPKDFFTVIAYLKENFNDLFYWLGAKGDNSAMRWVDDGSALTKDEPWNRDYDYRMVKDNYCLMLCVNCYDSKDDVTFLAAIRCIDRRTVLCG